MRPAFFRLSLVGCLALVLVGLGWQFGRSALRHPTLSTPTATGTSTPISPTASASAAISPTAPLPESEPPRLGRIRSRFELAEAESTPPFRTELPGAAARTASDLEDFFARHIDPLFHRNGGWQIYNPDRLDRGQESARTPSLAFAAGLRYRHSF